MTPKIEVRLSPSNTTPNISLHIVVLCPCSCELKVFLFFSFFTFCDLGSLRGVCVVRRRLRGFPCKEEDFRQSHAEAICDMIRE